MNDEMLTQLERVFAEGDGKGLPPAFRETVDSLLSDPTTEPDRVEEWVAQQTEIAGGDQRIPYLRAALAESEGNVAAAAEGYLKVARQLSSVGDWDGVRQVAKQALPLRPDERFVRLLVSAGEHLEDADGLAADLEWAQEFCPDAPPVLWAAAQRASAAGHAQESGQLAAQAFTGWVAQRDMASAEEALLDVLESDDPGALGVVLAALPSVVRTGETELFTTVIDLAQDQVFRHGLHHELAVALEAALLAESELAANAALRRLYSRAVTAELGGESAVGMLVHHAGLDDPGVPFGEALRRWNESAGVRPGVFVEHNHWGVGKVVANDGERLTIDFEDKPGHKMSLELAARTLTALSPDTLKVALFENRNEVIRQSKEEPASLLVRVLQELGGEATTADLKRRLAPAVIEESRWAAWWKSARQAAAGDPRIDDSQAFRQRYSLAAGDLTGPAALPPLDVSRGARRAIGMIRRLLEQHPDALARARQQYGPQLRYALDDCQDADDRLLMAGLLAEWYEDQRTQWLDAIAQALDAGASVTVASTPTDQSALLELTLSTPKNAVGALGALASRYLPVRERALAALRETEGATVRVSIQSVMDRLPDSAREFTSITAHWLEGRIDSRHAPPALTFLFHLIGLLQSNAHRTAASKLLTPSEPFVERLRGESPDPVMVTRVAGALENARLHDDDRCQLESVLCAAGLDKLAPGREPPVSDEGGPSVLDLHFSDAVVLMTRPTLARRQDELEELRRQLRTEIPEMIKRARELGDLSENAEYDAARQRQGIVNSQCQHLQALLERAQCIEDLDLPEDCVTVGVEVKLRRKDDGSDSVLWILGEGDNHLADHVVSYRAPVGAALIGRRVGDEIEVEVEGRTTSLTIVALERRLPES